MLAGVGKCGTTDVWDKIVKHPEIVGILKEPRWWTRLRVGKDTALLGVKLSTFCLADDTQKW